LPRERVIFGKVVAITFELVQKTSLWAVIQCRMIFFTVAHAVKLLAFIITADMLHIHSWYATYNLTLRQKHCLCNLPNVVYPVTRSSLAIVSQLRVNRPTSSLEEHHYYETHNACRRNILRVSRSICV
jgi:hypothetical protein